MGSSFRISKKEGYFSLAPIRNWLQGQPDGEYQLDAKHLRAQRSNKQNGYLWGVCYALILEGLVDAGWEDFTSTDDVHELMKSQFASKRVVNRHTGEIIEFPSGTSQMTTSEFSAYIQEIRRFAEEYLSVWIPESRPEDLAETKIL